MYRLQAKHAKAWARLTPDIHTWIGMYQGGCAASPCKPPCDAQELVKQKGMETLAAENSKSLMRMAADTMSQVAEATWDTDDKWLGILESMQKFITSNDARLVEAALVLFSKLTEWLGQDPIMQNMQRQMYDVLLQFLQSAPNDDVRIAACKASTNFILVRPSA